MEVVDVDVVVMVDKDVLVVLDCEQENINEYK